MKDPIIVRSAGDELQCGCTGCPADSHYVRWVVVSPLVSCRHDHVNHPRSLSLPPTVQITHSFRYPGADHWNGATNAAVCTRCNILDPRMTQTTHIMATWSQRQWQTMSDQSTGTNERKDCCRSRREGRQASGQAMTLCGMPDGLRQHA